MMRWLCISLISVLVTLLEAEELCYSVQLNSFVIKEKNLYRFEGYPPSCKLIEGERLNTVRCGCFEKYSQAKEHHALLRTDYPDAMIVETYRYRFSDGEVQQASSVDEQELKLLFQVFSFSSDLENAYATAKKALRAYPRSLYWHNKMAEVSMWTERREEAVEHMMYVYKRTHSKELEKKLLEYALLAYQYETAAAIIEKKVKQDPSEENVQKMVYIFDLAGRPEASALILDEVYRQFPSRTYLLTQQLQIYLNMGETESASGVVKKIEKVGLNDMSTAYLLSYYYFLRQDVDASYRALKAADLEKSKDTNTTRYYMQLSDLSWYVKAYKEGAEASIQVDEAGAARLVDYERILAVYKKSDPRMAMKAALDAYQKFSQHYLFYTYAYLGIEQTAYHEVLALCEKIEQDRENTLVEEALYWMIKAQLYGYTDQTIEAQEAFYKAQMISPSSQQIIESYIWFLMDIRDSSRLIEILTQLEEENEINKTLWLPMAVAYFYLQYTDRAEFYLSKLKDAGVQSRQIHLLDAYVMQSQNREDAFYKVLTKLETQMRLELRADPMLERSSDFMQEYLGISMFLSGADTFAAELEKAKNILSKEAYEELSLSFAMRENVDEQVHRQMTRMQKNEPWIRLNYALSSHDLSEQQELLYKYYRILPLSDTVTAAQNTQQVSLAQDMVFEGLAHNRKNALTYDQMRQLYEESADVFSVETGVLDRSGLEQVYAQIDNRYYMAKGYTLEGDLFIGSNTVNDSAVFKSIPSTSTALSFGLTKDFARGDYTLSFGVKDSAEAYYTLGFTYRTALSRRLDMELSIDKAAKAEESVYLLVGGYKDRIALQARYAILGSSTVGCYLEHAGYRSDDGTDLGSGYSGRIDYSYLQRSAYPDISVTPFYTFGKYDETSGSKGVIDDMLTFPDAKVVSDDFWYAGFDLSYGMQNRYNYTRVWRPFISISPYYNGLESKYNFGFSSGIGGAVFGQDHLAFVIDYSESVNGTSDQLWRSYFSYKILY